MSKVEIDTSEVSLEEQIEAASKNYFDGYGDCRSASQVLRETMRDFSSGKFAKRPLPEIVKPSWARYAWVTHNQHSAAPYYVEANTCPRNRASDPLADSYMIGPGRRTEREAILAFNALLGQVWYREPEDKP